MHISKEQFENFLKEQKEPAWFKEKRSNAFEAMQHAQQAVSRYGLTIQIELPEQFSNMKYQHLSSAPSSFAFNLPKEIIVHHNHQGKQFERLKESVDLSSFFTADWDIDMDKDLYTLRAAADDVLFLSVPDGYERKEPLLLTQVVKGSSNLSALYIHIKKNSHVTFVINKELLSSGWYGEEMKILAEANSHVHIIIVQTGTSDCASIQRRIALLKKGARVEWTEIDLAGAYVRGSQYSLLNGEGSETKQNIFFLASENQRYDFSTICIHHAKKTQSDVLTKGVVNHHAKALSRGLIKIGPNAAGSNGYETQNALILTNTAEADAIPNLEIHNHDVKCSHGSTIGQVDKEKLFYLMSRSLSEDTAKKTLVEGYFTPTLQLFEEQIREKMSQAIAQKLEKQESNFVKSKEKTT